MRSSVVVVTLLVLWASVRAAPLVALAGELPRIEIKEWRLKNGLRVLFAAHRRVPAVTTQIWYHVGSKDERPGIRGAAHLFEHLMFKGSQHVRPEEHARMVAAIGGMDNAYTTQDFTVYHQTLPRRYLEFGLKLEAERMRDLHLTEFTIKSERQVVQEEKRMRLENSPIGRALEAIHALAYTRHPYAWTPAGDIADLDRVSLAECRRFYDTYYIPANATLIVVGDVTEAEVRAAVERQLGAIPPGKEPPRVTIVEPPQAAPREKVADWPSQLKVVLGAYHAPPAHHPDRPALTVVSYLLSAGKSSRLHQALVRRGKLAVAAGGFVQEQEQPGLFFVWAIGLPTHELSAMRRALMQEVERLAQKGPSASELEKVKNQLATNALDDSRSMEGVAQEIGRSTLLQGDPRAFLQEVERLDWVQAEDVKRVARTYLRPSNLSLVLLDGQGGGEKGREP